MNMINQKIELTNLEKEVLLCFLEKNHLDKEFFGREFDLLKILDRNITVSGFVTKIATEKLFEKSNMKSLRWTNVMAILNEKIEVGFLIYIDNYFLNGIEGFTYGERAWPKEISSFKAVGASHT